jgi:hypothetical protein
MEGIPDGREKPIPRLPFPPQSTIKKNLGDNHFDYAAQLKKIMGHNYLNSSA